MTQPRFAPGHRVVVRAENGYDTPEVSAAFGLMAGHYGKVKAVNYVTAPPIIVVEILGKIDGPTPPAMSLDDDTTWHFYDDELEHTD